MNHLQTDTLIAAWRDDAETARKAGHEQTAREIEAAAGLFERQAAEIKTLRENNAALQAELDDGHAELREGRDALAAREASAKNLMSRLIDAPAYHGGPRPETVQEFIDWASGGIDYLARRDARMKAEAMTEACRACLTIELGQRDMAYRHTEADGDGDEMVVGDGVNYANKAMGAGHCRERIAELIAKYRKQAEGES